MKVRFTEPAFIELREIIDYIAADNPKAAVSVGQRINELISTISVFPGIGHLTDEPGSRVMPTSRYPYLVFYTVEADEVVIIHVRHAARQRP